MSSTKCNIVFDEEKDGVRFFGELPLLDFGITLGVSTRIDGDNWSEETGYNVLTTVSTPLSELESLQAQELITNTAETYGNFSLHLKLTAKQELEKHLGLKLRDYAVDWGVVLNLIKHYEPSELLMMFPGSMALAEIIILGGYSIQTLIGFCYKTMEQGFVKIRKPIMSYLDICLIRKKHSAGLEVIMRNFTPSREEMFSMIARCKNNKAALKRLVLHFLNDREIIYNILLSVTNHYEMFLFVVSQGIDLKPYHYQLLRDIIHDDANFHVFIHLLDMCREKEHLSEFASDLANKPKMLKMLLKHCQNHNIYLSLSYTNTDASLTPAIILGGYSLAVNLASFDGSLGMIPYSELIKLNKKGDEIAIDVAREMPPYQMEIAFEDEASLRSIKSNSLELFGLDTLPDGNTLSLSLNRSVSPSDVAKTLEGYGPLEYSVY